MSELDVLFPVPNGKRNADDMGMPKLPQEAGCKVDEKTMSLLAARSKAKKDIQQILINLETETGYTVDRISISSVSITNIGDALPKYIRSVEVDIKPFENNVWA
jgi:hypothetical protein